MSSTRCGAPSNNIPPRHHNPTRIREPAELYMETRGTGMRCGGAAYAALGLLLLSMLSRVSALSVTVSDVECVYEYVFYDGDTVSGNFVVDDQGYWSSSDQSGVDFTVTAPGGHTVHTLKGTSGDKFEFKALTNGMYKFCFHNPSSTPETVSFNIHTGHIPSEHDLAKDEHLDPINVKIAELREALETVTLEQRYLKARDARHRHTNESTRRRVIFYTVGEYLLLALASGLQVVFIRRLFSKSVAYNRV
ncbi:Transmembrane emp24 domain-containing protein p24beta3 [Sesamum alatum]|uniref:Transmembrane emp24 domain-containing protein p24beta3 n=1 Tax=Sesamum alatum TaxID=300844 RepID=A0AAE1YQD8_9LAMI|nr:Transmembrane emp24 domain-containing protein p24beta3 [Sesamum alatum]